MSAGTYTWDPLAFGFPIKSAFHGGFGWSSVNLFRDGDRVAIVDAGSPAHGAIIRDRLAGLGLVPGDVTDVLLTHLHWDHIANVDMFPNATVTVHAAEVDWATHHPEPDTVFLSMPYVRQVTESGIPTRFVTGDAGGELLPGVSWMFTPGHTPGHVTYRVAGAEGDFLVCGDAIKNRVELFTGDVDMSMDQAASRRSIEQVRSIMEADADVVLLPGHDNRLRFVDGGVVDDGPTLEEIFTVNFDASSGPAQVRLDAASVA